MAFIQKDDKFVERMAELSDKIFGRTDDVFLTMRYSELHDGEEFSNTVGFGGWMWLLDGAVAQLKNEAQALQKLKALSEERDKQPPPKEDELKEKEGKILKEFNLPRLPRYNPKDVDYFLEAWGKYDADKPPDDPMNITILRNHLWRFNRNLVAALCFRYIHLALLNGRYATARSTMKLFVDLTRGLELRPKEIETTDKKRFHMPRSVGGKKDESS